MDNADSSSPIALVIFGVTGDLSHRKLAPALYEIVRMDRQPAPLKVIGFARRDWSDEKMRSELGQAIREHARTEPIDENALQKLLDSMHYVSSTFEDPDGYQRLARYLDENQLWSRMFYLAAPPESYTTIIDRINSAELAQCPNGWTRIVVEKPYGHDLDSAMKLDETIHKVFDESQIYRIDHYLGKETVQNILVFRFANGVFEPLWNRHYVDHVQITVSETVGIEGRAGYYDDAGVIRDIFQNHLLQLLTLTAMEAPVEFNPNAVRDEKIKVLQALRPVRGEEAIQNTFRAQYVSGSIDGKRVVGYKDEEGVSPTSITETLMAARLYVDNWRWAGVPWYLRSGKRLPKRVTHIAVQFKQVPLSLFAWQNFAGNAPNRLVINIQPEESIMLTIGAKAPGPMNEIRPVKMEFDYSEFFEGEPPEAYERLLLDVMVGDPTLFTRSDEVKAAWAITTDILNAWASYPVRNLPVYEAGTIPEGLEEFIRHEAPRKWCLLDM